MNETKSLNEREFNQDLLRFLGSSPTPFHAAGNLAARFREAGYTELREGEAWALSPGGKYFVTRNASALMAFRVGRKPVEETGFRMTGSHSDSPGLRVKPNAEIPKLGYLRLGVEVYGGVLLSTWFDRDLSLAGRVGYLTASGKVASALVDFERPIAYVPSLAIHLDRDVNDKRCINKQWEMPPILMQTGRKDDVDLRGLLGDQLRKQGVTDVAKVLEYELLFYDTQKPALVGWNEEFLASARLDNLLSCFIAATALRDSDSDATCVMIANDHEEVGSASTSGAEGPFLRSVLERVAGSSEKLMRAVDRSFFVSADNAHGIHPNYAEKHDAQHGPILNQGPVIKINSNQRYATNSETASIFSWICESADVPVQHFVVRSDMACGSTIGPITATVLGVRTVDVGVPQFAMHSCRELAGARDAHMLYRALRKLYSAETL